MQDSKATDGMAVAYICDIWKPTNIEFVGFLEETRKIPGNGIGVCRRLFFRQELPWLFQSLIIFNRSLIITSSPCVVGW